MNMCWYPEGKDVRSCLAGLGLMRRNKIRQPCALRLLTFPFCVCALRKILQSMHKCVYLLGGGRWVTASWIKAGLLLLHMLLKTSQLNLSSVRIFPFKMLQICSSVKWKPLMSVSLTRFSHFYSPIWFFSCQICLSSKNLWQCLTAIFSFFFLFKPKVEHSPQTEILQSVDLVID